MNILVEIAGDRHMETLRRCGGYYEGQAGDLLVAYAGDYAVPDGTRKHFVGRVYANFAKAEENTNVLKFFAGCLATRIEMTIGLANVDVFCGAPLGGYGLAYALGLCCGINVIKAEKKVTVAGSGSVKEESKVIFNRHKVRKGQRVVIVEDICNNFSTTAKLIKLIEDAGGIVVAIVCFLNRSLIVDSSFSIPKEAATGTGSFATCTNLIPVISLVRRPIMEYKQEDPEVAGDVARDHVVWTPKKDEEWARLMLEMDAHK